MIIESTLKDRKAPDIPLILHLNTCPALAVINYSYIKVRWPSHSVSYLAMFCPLNEELISDLRGPPKLGSF